MPKRRNTEAENAASKELASRREKEGVAALNEKYQQLYDLVPEEYYKKPEKGRRHKASYLKLVEGTMDYLEDLNELVVEELGISNPKIDYEPLPPQHYAYSRVPGESIGYKRPERRRRIYMKPVKKNYYTPETKKKYTKYREALKEAMERLRYFVPLLYSDEGEEDKRTKLTVLVDACDHIHDLQTEKEMLESERNDLLKQNRELKVKLEENELDVLKQLLEQVREVNAKRAALESEFEEEVLKQKRLRAEFELEKKLCDFWKKENEEELKRIESFATVLDL